MSTKHLRNIELKEFRRFLEQVGCRLIRQKSGHEMYSREDLLRSITLQSHISPVPEFIIKNILRQLNMTKEEFFEELEK